MQVCVLEGGNGILFKSPRAWLRLSPPFRHGDSIPLTFAVGQPLENDCCTTWKTYDGCIGVLQCRTNTLVLLGSGHPQWAGNDKPSVLDSCDMFALSNEDGGALAAQAADLAGILTDGSFFYSRSVDYSLRLSRQKAQTNQLKQVPFQPLARNGSQPADSAIRLSIAGPYVWSSFMLEPFFALGETLAGSERTILYEDFLLPLVRGFFGVKQVRHGSATIEVRMISRRDWHREGTHFAKRGIDADGNVAAFAETELQLRVLPSKGTLEQTVSFVQVRGSVPAYWTEKPREYGPLRVKISKDAVNRSLDPFERHIRHLSAEYGPVHSMAYLHGPHHGLLDAEAHLLQVYEQLVKEVQHSPSSLAGQITLDPIGLNPRNPKLIPDEIGGMADEFLDQSGWTHVVGGGHDTHAKLVREQTGVLRINCRDCCDRTNLAQFSCSAEALRKILLELKLPPLESDSELDRAHRHLWAKNGDMLSGIYTGCPSMTSNFIESGCVTHRDAVHNKENSVHRLMQALLHDKRKNCATEILTGEHAPTRGRRCEHASLLVPDKTLPPLRLRRVFGAAH